MIWVVYFSRQQLAYKPQCLEIIWRQAHPPSYSSGSFNFIVNFLSNFWLRLFAGAIGVSIGDTVFANQLEKRLSAISDLSSATAAGTVNSLTGYTGLTQITPASLRDEVLHAYTRSLATVWMVFCPLCFVGLLCGGSFELCL